LRAAPSRFPEGVRRVSSFCWLQILTCNFICWGALIPSSDAAGGKGHIFYIETGERFPQFIKEHNLSSRLAAGIYKTGSRQPDFIAVWMWSHLFGERLTGEEHLIFERDSSFPSIPSVSTTSVSLIITWSPPREYRNLCNKDPSPSPH
jgi:hypothetical protein